jgi:hypothetical protein
MPPLAPPAAVGSTTDERPPVSLVFDFAIATRGDLIDAIRDDGRGDVGYQRRPVAASDLPEM